MSILLSHGGTTIYTSQLPSREILVGTVEGVVRLQRTSASGTWEVAGQSLKDGHISSLVFEEHSGLLFVGVFHQGVFASRDNGRTWEQRNEGLREKDVYTVAAHRRAGGGARVFAGSEPAHRREDPRHHERHPE